MTVVEELEEWSIVGEVPTVTPRELKLGAAAHFISRARSLSKEMHADHEVATTIDDEHTSVISGRKREIAIGATIAISALSAAGILAARHQLRVNHKNKK